MVMKSHWAHEELITVYLSAIVDTYIISPESDVGATKTMHANHNVIDPYQTCYGCSGVMSFLFQTISWVCEHNLIFDFIFDVVIMWISEIFSSATVCFSRIQNMHAIQLKIKELSNYT